MTLRVFEISEVQAALKTAQLDGWLVYDFRRSNDIGCEFLRIPLSAHLTRRFFYWIPTSGQPVKICHVIEPESLSHLPGKEAFYRSWQELENILHAVLSGTKVVAMEYSPGNAIPTVSKVDAGTMDVIRRFNVDVVGSADLLQLFTSVLSEEQLRTQHRAASLLETIVESAWQWIAQCLMTKQVITDYDVQQYILGQFEQQGLITDSPPICSLNADSANPHFAPSDTNRKVIRLGDFILIDLWAKENAPGSIYGDITRVGVAAPSPTAKQKEIFEIVKLARDAATHLVKTRFAEGNAIYGYEVDQAARDVIAKAGYGAAFLHRTGHSIGTQVHGNGANIDNLETQDRRQLLKGTCFSIEPGIYLKDQFGVRLEYDLLVDHSGAVHITGGAQQTICTLINNARANGTII